MNRHVDVAIIGAGHAGLNALKEVRKVTDSFVLINGGPLGTTCARVGCMPSKAALHAAQEYHKQQSSARWGIDGLDRLRLNKKAALERIREVRDTFVDLVLANSTDNMNDELLEGYAEFLSPNTLQIGPVTVQAQKTIIAAGSRPRLPPQWLSLRRHMLTTEEIFEIEELPERLAVIGLGYVGVEIAQALSRLGVDVIAVDSRRQIAGINDPEVNQAAIDILSREFPLWLGEGPVITEESGRLRVQAGDKAAVVDKLFVSVGRRPNTDCLGLERLGVPLDGFGVPAFDRHTMQVADLPVYIAGDVTGQSGTLQEAADEGRIAGFNAVRERPLPFRRKTPMTIVFSDPNIVRIGADWSELDMHNVAIGRLRFGSVGRAFIMGKNRGLLRLYAQKPGGKLLGASMIGTGGEHLAHLLAWSIQQEMTVAQMLRMPFYHPVLEEALQDALRELAAQLDASDHSLTGFEPLTKQADLAWEGATGAC